MGRLSRSGIAGMRGLTTLAGFALVLPVTARAHATGHVEHWWSLDPWAWGPLLLAVILYARGWLRLGAPGRRAARGRALWFCAGMATLFLALVWPFDVLSGISFAAHMTQHMLLIAVAAPLLVVARPGGMLVAGLPAALRRCNRHAGSLYRAAGWLSRPAAAFVLHGIIVWVWHVPMLFELALHHEPLHIAEHMSFLGSALLFWHALHRDCHPDGRGCGTALLWILGTLMHTGLLGALLTFAPVLLYPYYLTVEHPPLAPLADQQLAGLMMWVPGGFCYLAAALGYAALGLRAGARTGGVDNR